MIQSSMAYHACMTRTLPRDEAFIMARVAVVESGCWEWLQYINPATGYGSTSRVGGKETVGSHVLSYEIFVGEIPEGISIDHLCRNTKCCNPRHLEAVSPSENARRSVSRGQHRNAVKTKCPNCGGPFTRVTQPSRPEGFRRCVPCQAAKRNNYARARRKEAQRG